MSSRPRSSGHSARHTSTPALPHSQSEFEACQRMGLRRTPAPPPHTHTSIPPSSFKGQGKFSGASPSLVAANQIPRLHPKV
eukprot:366193-Chlamydomonas_euryale.AAC.2